MSATELEPVPAKPNKRRDDESILLFVQAPESVAANIGRAYDVEAWLIGTDKYKGYAILEAKMSQYSGILRWWASNESRLRFTRRMP